MEGIGGIKQPENRRLMASHIQIKRRTGTAEKSDFRTHLMRRSHRSTVRIMRGAVVFGIGTVNPQVTGSSPVRGATEYRKKSSPYSQHAVGAFSYSAPNPQDHRAPRCRSTATRAPTSDARSRHIVVKMEDVQHPMQDRSHHQAQHRDE